MGTGGMGGHSAQCPNNNALSAGSLESHLDQGSFHELLPQKRLELQKGMPPRPSELHPVWETGQLIS